MKFKQLTIGQFRQDGVGPYGINISGYRLAVLGGPVEIPALELSTSCVLYGSIRYWPLTVDNIAIPKERPCSKLIKHIEMSVIYSKSTVQETQELALDPVYVADFSLDPPKPIMQQIEWLPLSTATLKAEPILAVLSNYGACQLRRKDKTSRHWNDTVCDINKLYLQNIFPFDPTTLENVKDFQAFKDHVDVYWITAFACHPNSHVFYTANAAGWIVAFCYKPEAVSDMRLYCKIKTTLGHITYLRAFHDFLLVGNALGVVKLFRLLPGNTVDAEPTIIQIECLWSKPDRMSCRRAYASYSRDSNSYYVVFTKAAHILVYELGEDGCLLRSATLYVGGIKITGLESISSNEFIVTTISGITKYIKVESNENDHFSINEQIVPTDLDIRNFQILDVVTTPNKAVWIFLLFRKRDYISLSKNASNAICISICKLTSIDYLFLLQKKLNISLMDPFVDYAVAMNLDIANNLRHDDYNQYCDLTNVQFLTEINDNTLQQLQIKLMLVKSKAKYEGETYRNIKRITSNELDFLLASIQATYIICRLRQLQSIVEIADGNKMLTTFQDLAGSCLKRKFHMIIRNLHNSSNDENLIQKTLEHFISLASETFKKLCVNFDCQEKCVVCENNVDEESLVCPFGHKVQRCCISYVQVPLFNRRYCAECNEVALDDDSKVMEIMTPDEILRCTFCRYAFIECH